MVTKMNNLVESARRANLEPLPPDAVAALDAVLAAVNSAAQGMRKRRRANDALLDLILADPDLRLRLAQDHRGRIVAIVRSA